MCLSKIIFCDQNGETVFNCQLDADHEGLHCYTDNNGLFVDSQPYMIVWKGDSRFAKVELESFISLMSPMKPSPWSN
jgi:hypothetical protein